MNRFAALIGALLLAFLSVSSACMASPSDWVHFTLDARGGNANELRANFTGNGGRGHNDWSGGFRPSQLIGMDINGFYTAGLKPLHFAMVR